MTISFLHVTVKAIISLLVVAVVSGCNHSANTHAAATELEWLQANDDFLPTRSDEATADDADNDYRSVSQVQTLHLQHHKTECEGFAIQECLLVRQSENEEWENLYEEIEGFDYEWGYWYELRVEITYNDKPMMDQADRTIRLIEIIKKEKCPDKTTFTVPIHHFVDTIKRDVSGGYTFGSKTFICDMDVCASLETVGVQEYSSLVEFQHNTDSSGPLILTRVLCIDHSQTFRQSCLKTLNPNG